MRRLPSKSVEFGISFVKFGTLYVSRANTAVHLGVKSLAFISGAPRLPSRALRWETVFADHAVLRPERSPLAKRRRVLVAVMLIRKDVGAPSSKHANDFRTIAGV